MSSNFSRRGARKKQTRLTFDPLEPSSSAPMSPARVLYQTGRAKNSQNSSSPLKREGEEQSGVGSSGKKYNFLNQTPRKQEKNGTLPFKPSSTSATSSNTRSSQPKKDGKFSLKTSLIIFTNRERGRRPKT